MRTLSINKVIISGNLTRDPETSTTTNGTTVMSFGVAVNDRKRNAQTGEWEDVANFVDCVMFGSRAEALSRILVKGMKCAIEGRLRYSSWEKDGQKRSKLEVVVDEIEFLSQRGQGQQGGYQPQQYQPQPQQYQPQPQQYQPQAQPQQYAQYQPQPQQYPQYQPQPQQYAAPAPAQYSQPTQQAAPVAKAPSPSQTDDVYDEDIPF